MTINHSLKIKIIIDYLYGMKREDIAKKYGISTGSVAAIADEFEEEMPDIHKLRAMMVMLKATGNSPKLFYHAIRLHEYIKNQGLTEAKAEYILEIFQEFAFKKNYNISELIEAIIKAYEIAEKWGTDLEHLDQHVNNKVIVLETLKAQHRKIKNDIEFLPHRLNIDLADYQEYQRNKPTFQKSVIESDIKDRRIKLLVDQVHNLKVQFLESDREIERLNQLLSQQSKKEDEYYNDYQQDIENFDSNECLVEDSNEVEDKNDSL